jgi:hypothetical protein
MAINHTASKPLNPDFPQDQFVGAQSLRPFEGDKILNYSNICIADK